MTLQLDGAAGKQLGRLDRAHPEWWVYPVAAAVWLSLAFHDFGLGTNGPSGFFHYAVDMTLMVVAMMLPLGAPAAGEAARSAFWSRRRSTAAFYLAGFAVAWAVYGVTISWLAFTFGPPAPLGPWLAATAGVALLWQSSRTRQRAMTRCGSSAVYPSKGWRGMRLTATAGGRHGGRCVTSCCASMIVMLVVPHPAMMAGLLGLTLYERRVGPNPFAERRWRAPAAVYAALAVLGVVLSV